MWKRSKCGQAGPKCCCVFLVLVKKSFNTQVLWCGSEFHEESKEHRRALPWLTLFCLRRSRWHPATPPLPINQHVHSHTHMHGSHWPPPHSLVGVWELIPSVSMVSGWWGSVWCQAVSSTDLTPSLQHETDSVCMCVCLCTNRPMEAYGRTDWIFRNTDTNARLPVQCFAIR